MSHLGSLPGSPLDDEVIGRLEGSTCLVTGATGVVGLNLLHKLSELVAAGKLKMKLIGASKSGTLPPGFRNPGLIEMISGDFLAPGSVSDLPEADFVIHGATYGQPAIFESLPVETVLLNTSVTAELLKKTQRGFLFLSSSEVYSGLEEGPFSEREIGNSNTDHPRAAYIEAKRCGEALTLSYPGGSAIANVARLSLAYGPGARETDRRVLYELILRGLRERRVFLKGNGQALRSYLFVTDAVKYLLGILVAGSGNIYNVGGDRTISLENLANLIAEVMGVPKALPEDTSTQGFAYGAPDLVSLDMRRTRGLLRPFEHVPLEIGLGSTVEWMRQFS